ncbi:GNAT family N-acetyltransferase [Sphingopyxis sp.]|uniref:GNAT family N-acetyltransferase n=1 Tax=Sphingopyxis sp. TaxID=1908224 RepID=UPI003D098F63
MDMRRLIEAYRWQRGLGHNVIATPYGRIVANVAHPTVWDANHADAVTAEQPEEIEALIASMDEHLAHAPWRVVHTDPFTPEAFSARLALDGYIEQPAVIQMVLDRTLQAVPGSDIIPIETDGDWRALATLVRRDHEEGARTGGTILSADVTDGIVAGYRAKDGPYRFHLARIDGIPVAYGACAAAPSGPGMIEDLFTLPTYRRRGIASALIAHFSGQLVAQGCDFIFLGALVGEQARHLYAKLGFRPVMLSRCWVRQTVKRQP